MNEQIETVISSPPKVLHGEQEDVEERTWTLKPKRCD